MWGSAPRPGRGQVPCTPLLGLRPKGTMCLAGYLCLDLAFPFGATPQNPTRGAWPHTSFSLEMWLRKVAVLFHAFRTFVTE